MWTVFPILGHEHIVQPSVDDCDAECFIAIDFQHGGLCLVQLKYIDQQLVQFIVD